MVKQPLISICIPTYKRQAYLPETILSVLNQTYQNFEIIISDNDNQKSSQAIAESFQSKKIRYFAQKKNVGMTENFGKTIDAAKGEYIVLLGDDDPIEPRMLETLVYLQKQYPDAGSYFGAPYMLVLDDISLRIHKLNRGKTRMRNKKIKSGAIRVYEPAAFLPAFLRYEIFEYFFWSCGMIRSDIVRKIGKAHDLYGSYYLTDFAYVVRAGLQAPVVTINKELGSQRFHSNNYGRANDNLLTVKGASRGFHQEFINAAKEYDCVKDLEKFITNWVITHIYSVVKLRLVQKQSIDKLFLIKLYLGLCQEFPYFRPSLPSYTLRILFPAPAQLFDRYKWIFEKRTVRLGLRKILHFDMALD